jgi:hypothetical protein
MESRPECGSHTQAPTRAGLGNFFAGQLDRQLRMRLSPIYLWTFHSHDLLCLYGDSNPITFVPPL